MKFFKNWLLTVGFLLLFIAGSILVVVGYFKSPERQIPIVFSNSAMLFETWTASKHNTLDSNVGRTVDSSQKNITTSEGQSYTMLRAVWMDDKATFDKSWAFTKSALQRPDSLFSWKYGQRVDGTYGILTSDNGQNSAADADQDIAMSLLMAYSRWSDPSYLEAAKPIITSIWNKEVVMIQGKPVLTADDLESDPAKTTVVVNPSYFAFANYKLFATIDKSHDWNGLAANSYDILNRVSTEPLDKTKSVGLPPNWITIDVKSGAFIPAASPNLDTNFGYDAMRIPFRLALDYQWFKDGRDLDAMSRFAFLKNFWNDTGVLNAVYAHDGTVVQQYESPAMYGASLGYFELMEPKLADEVYTRKLQTLYSPDQESWKAPAPGYYEDNWAWFGLGLHQNALTNITVPN